jgi:hypothetical protein
MLWHFGKPDLFITITCNPNWREIKKNLLPNQQASDRPDLIARVFHLKKEHLMHLIVKQDFFGKVNAHVHVIEFQKQRLLHAPEAVTWMMPRSLRRLLVRILIHCQPVEPGRLWNEYKDALSEDLFE